MWFKLSRFLSLLIASTLGFFWHVASAQQPKLDCDVGPLSKTYGTTPWLVYTCSDGKSVVAVTAADSPAAPFYFILFPKEGKYTVYGEGTGPKQLTDRAYAELTRLTDQEIAALIKAAAKHGAPRAK